MHQIVSCRLRSISQIVLRYEWNFLLRQFKCRWNNTRERLVSIVNIFLPAKRRQRRENIFIFRFSTLREARKVDAHIFLSPAADCETVIIIHMPLYMLFLLCCELFSFSPEDEWTRYIFITWVNDKEMHFQFDIIHLPVAASRMPINV